MSSLRRNYLRPESSEGSSLNPSKFSHRLLYSDKKKNSTYNSKHSSLSSNFNSNSASLYPKSYSEYLNENSNTFSSPDSVNFNRNLLNSYNRNSYNRNSYNRNSTIKKSNYSRNYAQSKLSDYYTATESKINRSKKSDQESTDLNNNNEFYSDDSDVEPKMTYTYLKNCAIYGVPTADRVESYSKLVGWWIFSISYDCKWFISRYWRKIIVVFILFFLYEFLYIMINY